MDWAKTAASQEEPFKFGYLLHLILEIWQYVALLSTNIRCHLCRSKDSFWSLICLCFVVGLLLFIVWWSRMWRARDYSAPSPEEAQRLQQQNWTSLVGECSSHFHLIVILRLVFSAHETRIFQDNYCKVSNIRRRKSQNLNASCVIL